MTLVHRPFGAEHPYATSPDQRVPVRPLAGQAIRIGVSAAGAAPACEWQDLTSGEVVVLQAAPGGVAPAADAAALAGGEGHLAAAQAGAADGDGAWSVTTPPLAADHRYRYRWVATGEQPTGWFEVEPAQWVADGGTLAVDGVTDRVVPGSVSWLRDSAGLHAVRFALPLAPSEHVVGFGERFEAVDQRGRRLDAQVFEQYKAQGRHGRTYLPMPFAHVVGGDGWGFHVRTTRRTWYDVGATDRGLLEVEVALGGAPDERLELALYEGDPTAVLTAFLDEAGRAEELPAWVLRLWASGNEWNTQALVTQRMDTHRDLDIPVGVVVIEAWSDEQGISIWRDARYPAHPDGSAYAADEFEYPPDGAWPDPAGMVRELHARGIKVVLWQIPLLHTQTGLEPGTPPDAQVLVDGRAMVRLGHAVREADGSPYKNRGWWFPQALMADLSTPEGRDWWTAKRRYLVTDIGVDGFKTDGGEHAWGHDLRYADGRRGDEGNNLNPVHYAHAFGDLLRSAGKAPVTFSRAGFTGSQAHGVFWAGDEDSSWEGFVASLTAGITAGACGIVYWGWDIAGFSGPLPEPELYLRAAAASTFLPVMQYHAEFNHHRLPLRDRTPWNVAEQFADPDVVTVFRRYAQLRERLLPYLVEQARRAVQHDRPLLRGLFVDHPHDEAIWDHPREFLLGDDVLVNPVTEPGATTWDTYLPEGEWVDAWDGTAHAGRGVVTRDVPRDVVPVYLRRTAADTLRPVFTP